MSIKDAFNFEFPLENFLKEQLEKKGVYSDSYMIISFQDKICKNLCYLKMGKL